MIHSQHVISWVLACIVGLLLSLISFDLWHDSFEYANPSCMEEIVLTDTDIDETDDEDNFNKERESSSRVCVQVHKNTIHCKLTCQYTSSSKTTENQRLGLTRRYGPEQICSHIMNNDYKNGACPCWYAPFLFYNQKENFYTVLIFPINIIKTL